MFFVDMQLRVSSLRCDHRRPILFICNVPILLLLIWLGFTWGRIIVSTALFLPAAAAGMSDLPAALADPHIRQLSVAILLEAHQVCGSDLAGFGNPANRR